MYLLIFFAFSDFIFLKFAPSIEKTQDMMLLPIRAVDSACQGRPPPSAKLAPDRIPKWD